MRRTLTGLCFILWVLNGQAQIFVDANANGAETGSSWEDAYTDLSEALNRAEQNDIIWVARGTYLPGGSNPTEDSSFEINVAVELFGGFSGTESSLSERDLDNNVTILSGDILGDDIDNDFDTNKEDNVLHVIIAADDLQTGRTVIDGFQISYGHTDGGTASGDDRRGGGMLSNGSDPRIRNCTFSQNFGHFGGALHLRAGFNFPMLVSNCRFIDNQASDGGAVY